MQQPLELRDPRELLKLQLLPLEGRQIEQFSLIGDEQFDQVPEPNAGQKLSWSQRRHYYLNSKSRIEQFWYLFEARAKELGAELPEGAELVRERVDEYDHGVDSDGLRLVNPIQHYMVTELGMSALRSASLYRKSQIAFLNSGIDGAKVAFREALFKELGFQLKSIAADYETLSEILQLQNSGLIAANHSPRHEFAGLMIRALNSPHEPHRQLVLGLLQQSERVFDLHNGQQVIYSYFINEYETLARLGKVQMLVRAIDPQKRMRDGIRMERETGEVHSLGPKSKRASFNIRVMTALQALTLLGYPISQALAAVELSIQNPTAVESLGDSLSSGTTDPVILLLGELGESHPAFLSCSLELPKE